MAETQANSRTLAVVIGVVAAAAGVAAWAALSGPEGRDPSPGAPAPSAAPSARGSAQAAGSAVGPSASAARGAPKAPELQWAPEDDVNPATIPEQREAMFRRMKKFLGVSDAALDEIRRLFATQKWMGQGNPKPTEHPMSRAECLKIRETARLVPGDEARCGAKNMVPIYNRKAGETAEQARACIDQYEFPNIACDYPVTWVPAHVAHQLCKAQGKRMCDAHEWEGACAGAVLPAAEEYSWSARPGEEIDSRRLAFQYNHNTTREITWAYGPTKDHSKCASNSRKSDGCVTPTWERCGTNTYPAGAFPECVSPFGVYDLHGNAAEHMNLPMQEGELASRGDELGQTEMKGSWFIFNRWEAHIDDCRWRAPSWHGGRVMSEGSHMNYHLGFRCCKDLPAK